MKIPELLTTRRTPQLLQWFGIALFVAIALPWIVHSAHTLNHHQLDKEARQNASAFFDEIGVRIGVIRTLLGSLEGLHYVSSDLDQRTLHQFSRELLGNAPFITTIGRYESIARNERAEFEQRMIDQGHPGLKIAEINNNGDILPRGDRSNYYPIALLEPLKPENLSLIGVDFGSVSGLANMLRISAGDNATLLAPLPEAWPNTLSLIAFSPVYRGKETPRNPDELLQQTTGGMWLGIDLPKLLLGVAEHANNFDVEVAFSDSDVKNTIYSRSAGNDENLYFKSFYDEHEFSNTWSLGGSGELIISMRKPLGLTGQALVLTTMAILSTLLIAALFIVNVRVENKRQLLQREDRQRLSQEQEKARNTLNTVSDAIIMLDPKYRVIQLNPAASVLLNTKPRLCIGKPLSTIVQFHELSDILRIFSVEQAIADLSRNGRQEFDLVPVGYSGDNFVLRLSLSTSSDHEGHVIGHVLVLRDISKERRMSRQLAYQANYDALTGCTNRYYFEQLLEAVVLDKNNTDNTSSFCYFDLDQFKVVNDICGHRVGDQLLIELTKKLQLLIREDDVLARLGGDDFGLLINNVSNDEANRITERVFEFFQNFIFKHEENTFAITASIGVVHINDSYSSVQDIMAAASIACYSIKENGQSSLTVYNETEAVTIDTPAELNWLPRLNTALLENQFRLHMQPMVKLVKPPQTPKTIHFEFLLRLADAEGQEITPWQIVQAAERYNLMVEIDRWVIKKALETVASLESRPGKDCTFSINLSGQSAADSTLASYIEAQMRQSGVDPSRIWFEMGENSVISNFSVAVDLMKAIRHLGSSVVLDDFGSGLSSFGYLKNLPVDVVKIDGQFIKGICTNAVDREMVRAIHQVGEAMNIQSVAEFVEDQETLDELIRIGVEFAQGFYIGKPQRVSDAIASLENPPKAA